MKNIAILLCLLFSTSVVAHNMSEETKKTKILTALHDYSTQIGFYDIDISSSPFKLDLDLQLARLDDGDKDIGDFIAKLNYKGEEHRIECDILTGEYGATKAIYFMIFRNCTLKNLNSYLTVNIDLNAKPWTDWKY